MKLTSKNPYPEKLSEICRGTPAEEIIATAHKIYEDGKQAQLDDDLKEAQEKVREIFEEIESHRAYDDCNEPIFRIGGYGTGEYADWWQALKQNLEHK